MPLRKKLNLKVGKVSEQNFGNVEENDVTFITFDDLVALFKDNNKIKENFHFLVDEFDSIFLEET